MSQFGQQEQEKQQQKKMQMKQFNGIEKKLKKYIKEVSKKD